MRPYGPPEAGFEERCAFFGLAADVHVAIVRHGRENAEGRVAYMQPE